MPLVGTDRTQCADLLLQSFLLGKCNLAQRTELCSSAEKRLYNKGDTLVLEGQPQEKMFVIASGEIHREKVIDGTTHNIDTQIGGATVGSLHVLTGDAAFATARVASDGGATTYEIAGTRLAQQFRAQPDFALSVAHGLALQCHGFVRQQRTPLLDQHAAPSPVLSVSIAASFESFYRAALNAFMNQQLTGVPMARMFPNMHVQVPVRVLYINGIKNSRVWLDRHVDPSATPYPGATRLAAACAPGLLMTPLSSLLEASNAGHANPEPLARRCLRGLVPRCAREIVFAIGLNQMTDWVEERVPNKVENRVARNALGSLGAGVLSGYLSHVAHNLSTLKLMNPNKSYGQHFSEYIARSESRVPTSLAPALRRPLVAAAALLAPTGCLLRTTQIVGSFVLLNGMIRAVNTLATTDTKDILARLRGGER